MEDPEGGDEAKASAPKKRKSNAADDSRGDAALFKADGTPVRNPVNYVAGIQKNGYKEKLFTADGDEIRDPVAFVEKMERNGTAKTEGPRGVKRQKTGGIYKADGTPIKNPVAFVAG